MKNIIISNNIQFEDIKNKFIEGGLEKIHVLSDFDKTLTRDFVNGKSIPSILSVLRDGDYLKPDYGRKAHELFDKYHPFENDATITKAEKKKLMEEWWRKHFKLLIDSGLNKKDIEKVVESKDIQFREGFEEFIDFLKDNNIPLVIMSSGGLGEESISLRIKKEGKLYDIIHIISNNFEWDEKGNAVSVKEPIIHGASKDEAVISNFPNIFKEIKNRKNVILMGDSLDDVDMVKGFDYDNLIKVCFLSKPDEDLESYKKIYDVVVLNDSSLDFVNRILKEVKPNP